ncbi:MAG TPA: hypothetical protein PLP42_06430 [Acidobacteriota bacterium]|nr:hypothetical protein [Acidobacteriota bacterium]
MNVELSFIRTENREALIELIASRLKSLPDPAGKQPKLGLPASYDLLLADEKKRKVVISPVETGWLAAVESKEVIDFALLQKSARC